MSKTSIARCNVAWGFFLLLSAVPLLFAEPSATVSIIDFEVQSDNPQFKYLGKGFAEFVGVELSKSRNMVLIEREKRTEIFKEQAFTLTGAVNEKDMIELGKMMSADYFVTGNIFDLLGKLTVTIKIVDTTTGKIAFEDKVTGKADEYDYISAVIAKDIMGYFKTGVPKDVVAKTEKPVSKPMEAAVKFSEAVDAYDKKDLDGARKELEEAKKLDPESEAVSVFLSKLAFNTAKFRVELFKHVALQNPAHLGLIKTDKAFFTGSLPASFSIGNHYVDIDENMKMTEDRGVAKLGYSFPLGNRMGVEVEGFLSREENNSRSKTTPGGGEPSFNPRFLGGLVSFGYRVSENFAVGLGLSLYECTNGTLVRGTRTINYADEVYHGGELGVLIKNTDSTAVFDSRVAYTDEDTIYSQLEDMYSLGDRYRLPVIMENTLVLTLKPNKTFFVTKGIGYFYAGRNTRTLELIPALEHWFSNSFSGRAGMELKHMRMVGENLFGLGGILGFTARRGDVDLDLNWEYRVRPSYFLPFKKYDEFLVSVSISYKNLFFGR
ncbi:MAG: hypothetical protein HY746_09105 [Elusimicrobia bacterium]|nr:hypothetical protein [Elusimicrobiota bacterium]